MKNERLNLLVAGLVACTGAELTASSAESTNSTALLERPDYWPWTVGAEGGSTGFGLFGSWRFLDQNAPISRTK